MNNYIPGEYYSVFDKRTGKKICDCGQWSDAMMLIDYDPYNRNIVKNINHLMGQVIDVKSLKSLPTNEIVDLGGKWDDPIPEGIDPYNLRGRQSMEPVKKKLKPSELKEFKPE